MLKTFSDVRNELNSLSSLFRFLLKSFSEHEYFEVLLSQLKPYMLSQLMARTGAITIGESGTIKLMGHKVTDQERLVLYNSGTFGQQIYKRLQQLNFSQLLWIDEDADLCNQDNLPVSDPRSLIDSTFDKLFIASLNPDFTLRIIQHLKELGVDDQKILKFDFKQELNTLIAEYGINPNSFEVFTA
ncbi:MAG: hypothetical protein B7Y76_11125 [Sphingobacteriia bacterium 35-40-5]|nr:MAG: hypothetical protein B7Y76_11125 [Sphingobacteriia bacterium 35-40-5]